MERDSNTNRQASSQDISALEPPRTIGDECVICLAPVSERAIAVPCNHCSFDFICLVSWFQEQAKCPLCKVTVSTIEYDWYSPTDFKTFNVAESQSSSNSTSPNDTVRRGRHRQHATRNAYDNEVDTALLRRRNVYRHRRYSLHIGSNRISGFRSITPFIFAQSPALQSRTRKWIRRELQVFDSIRQTGPSSPSRTWSAGRMNNAEYLLEYIIEMLKAVEAKGGKAEELLTEYLGQENSQLFLHELCSWMRSPYQNLDDWDRAVQYAVRPLSFERPREPRSLEAKPRNPLLLSELGGP